MITIRKDQKLPGCGVVQHMTGDQNGDVTLDINSLYKFMIVISDTTATNALYRHYGNDRVIAAFQELGLVGTQFNRAYYDEERESRGIQNYFVPKEIGDLLKKCTEGHWSVRRRQKNWSASYCSNRSITRWAVSCRWAFRSHIRQERKRTKRMMWGSFTGKEPFIACYASYECDLPTFEDFIRRTTHDLAVEIDPTLTPQEGVYGYY